MTKYKSNNPAEILTGCSVSIVFFIIFFLILNGFIALVLMLGWNAVLPTLLGWQPISYLTSFGITLLIAVFRLIFFGVQSEK